MSNAATAAAIQTELKSADFDQLPNLLARYEADTRAQVRKAVEVASRRYTKEQADRKRVANMYEFMRELGGDGIVLGVDEVGRGPVAGPLTVAAVALPASPMLWGIDDSKKLSAARREELTTQILDTALAVGIAHIEPDEIDACGMAASLRVAMRRAIENAGVEADAVLIDGVPVHVHPLETAVVHGDARVACIAAASIVAKVTRDAIMTAADELYPGYEFAKSKGYGSAEHIDAIRRLGLSPYHRESFCRNFI